MLFQLANLSLLRDAPLLKDATLVFYLSTAVCCPGFSFTVTLRKPLELSGPWWDKTSLSESNEPT